jgi:preprotein translocase subunit SecG
MDFMKKTLIILACSFFAAGMVIGYFRETTSVAHPPVDQIIVSIIGGGIIYSIMGAGICLIFVLPLYLMWKKKQDEKEVK